jgi:plastocyanin
MSADRTPLVNKLSLLVLVLILACLIILIAKQNSARSEVRRAPVPERAAEENAEPPVPPPQSTYLTDGGRRKAAAATAPAPAFSEVAQLPVSQTQASRPVDLRQPVSGHLVNLPSRSSSATPVSTGSNQANGAEIAGYVWLRGTPPSETPITLDATCGRLHAHPITTRHYVTTVDGRLANVFVYVKSGLENKRFPISTNAEALNNTDCLFEPYVLGVQTGQKIQLRNSDPFLHNVHATTKINQEFNLALPSRDRTSEKVFQVAEVFVRVKCDVHPWMFAYIGVVAHPFFAVTDGEGIYRFPSPLPPGHYTIVASHPKAGEATQDVTVHKGESLQLDFTLAVPLDP